MLLNLLACFNKIKLFQFVDSLFQFCRIKKTRCKRSSSPTRTHLTRYDKCFLHSKSLVKTDHMVKHMLLSSQNDFLLHGFRDGRKLTFCLCEPWVTICKWFSVPLQDHNFFSVFEKLNISVFEFFFSKFWKFQFLKFTPASFIYYPSQKNLLAGNSPLLSLGSIWHHLKVSSLFRRLTGNFSFFDYYHVVHLQNYAFHILEGTVHRLLKFCGLVC